jgi:hypothetical protein
VPVGLRQSLFPLGHAIAPLSIVRPIRLFYFYQHHGTTSHGRAEDAHRGPAQQGIHADIGKGPLSSREARQLIRCPANEPSRKVTAMMGTSGMHAKAVCNPDKRSSAVPTPSVSKNTRALDRSGFGSAVEVEQVGPRIAVFRQGPTGSTVVIIHD